MIKNLKALGRVAELEGQNAHEEFEHPEFFSRASYSRAERAFG